MVISKKSDQMIYHEESCPYAKRMQKKYSRYISEQSALERGYRPCSYCGGLHGIYLKFNSDLKMFGKSREDITASYDRIDKALCFRTDNGFWKVLEQGDPATYRLWHLNHGHFDNSLPDKVLMRRAFHRQVDVKSTLNMSRIVQYIAQHDKAKKIMDNDWKKLPKNTPKQRKYYKQAKRREQKKQGRRLDILFQKLEKGEL